MSAPLKSALLLAVLVILHISSSELVAERLPIKIFSSSDGLGSSFIDYLMRDSKGFLWICTRDGLSRFDGSEFITYQIGEKGAVTGVESIYEQSNGTYWVGTTNGFYRFTANALSQANPAKNGRPLLNAEYVNNARGHMYEDHAGKLWFLSNGLYDVEEKDGQVTFTPVDLHLPDEFLTGLNLVDNPEDSDGSFWFNAPKGLIRRLPDGRVIFFLAKSYSTQNVTIRDRNNLIWAGRGQEIFIVRPEPISKLASLGDFTLRKLTPAAEFSLRAGDSLKFPEVDGQVFRYTSTEFLNKHILRRIFESSDGHIWMPTEQNLVEYDGKALRLHTPSEGFVPALGRITEDLAGNLWFGGYSGLVRLDRKGLKSYDTADGLSSTNIYSITEDATGKLYVATGELSLSEWMGDVFHTVHPKFEPNSSPIWTSPFAFVDREGEWWFTIQRGLSRFGKVSSITELDGKSPYVVYNKTSGLQNDEAFHMYEDRDGDIWFSQFPAHISERTLVRLNRSSGELHTFTPDEGVAAGKSVASFIEDKFGNLWLGFYESGIARYRDGKFTVFDIPYGLPTGVITDLYIDRNDRMWIASAVGGVMVIDDTSAENPVIRHITTENGISSNNVRSITEDAFGRIYLGTVRGIDRLSPDTMRVKRYTVNDGLASDFVVDSHRDKNGDLWFATTNGLSRLHPAPDDVQEPPKVFLGKLVIAGEEQPIPQMGGQFIDQGELSSNQNNFQIDFFGLDMRAGERLRYQYKFETDADWSPPTEQRSVTFAKLSAGSYHFLVRAVDSAGQISAEPAVVRFTILQPLWLRWWFIALVTLCCIAVVVLFYRYRIANLRRVNAALSEAKLAEENLRLAREERIKELESVKTRIATDLHDDIGASLTQIAILSEVARASVGKKNGDSPDVLQKITDVSNELVGVMSDIVWAINPAKDRFGDLTQRMRRIASDMLSPKGIFVHFRSREEDKRLVVRANVRREAFLIFKESINNIAKHSNAKNIFVDLEISSGFLSLRIEDDGNGFDAGQRSFDDTLSSDAPGGNGLRNMRKRAAELNGVFDVESTVGRGTITRLTLPLEGSI